MGTLTDMNVEIETEAATFLFWEFQSPNFFALQGGQKQNTLVRINGLSLKSKLLATRFSRAFLKGREGLFYTEFNSSVVGSGTTNTCRAAFLRGEQRRLDEGGGGGALSLYVV